MNFKQLRTFSFVLLCAGGISCAPVQQYYMKEKVTVTNAPPRPGIQVDRFAYGKAIGAVDVLFVVDNTESSEAALSAFQQSYIDFVSRFKRAEARLLDYRVQVVTTPDGKSPGNWTSQDKGPADQLAQLFDSTPGGPPPLLSHGERGFLMPYHAAATGLMGEAFKGRVHTPTFIVFLLGADVPPGSSPEKDAAGFADAIRTSRGFYQTHVTTLSRTSGTTASRPQFPHCNSFDPAARTLPTLRQLPWKTQAYRDLCDPAWSNSYPSDLFASLIDFKKKLVLSHAPEQAETMMLRSANHLFRYGDDYRFDSQSNEIVFIRDPGLQEGDLLDASYYLKPPEEILSNGQTPPGPLNPGHPDGH